ncbi:MAG TPA: plastocyanin/azurin family copper-binding protein [Candidatus Limnocylindria bacterium]|jgi:plastocyanin
MMTFGGGWFGWLGPLIMLGLLVGVVLVMIWAVQAGGGRGEDDALAALRSRFARGEIDADQFDAMRRTLGAEDGRRARPNLGLIGLILIVAAILLGIGFAGTGPGWGWMGPGGMMGPWMGPMMGVGAGPTAPAGTSVTMAGSRFAPATLTIAAGETVRWFNDDALPHTVSATDGSWNSGNLAPGQAFERRFDDPGSYSYLCRYHPGMVGTVVVEG